MEGVERALRTAEAQMNEAAATARIRNAYFAIVVANAQTLYGAFTEKSQRDALSRALWDKDTDSSMLHRGLLVQINGAFENFVRSLSEAVLDEKVKHARSFFELEDKTRREYIHQSSVVLMHARDGNVRGRSYDFEGLKKSLGKCFMGIESFELKADVFTLLMGNCTSARLSGLFEALCLTDPFDDRIGEYPGLKRCANELSKRKVANFSKRTLDEQVGLRNELAHGNLTKVVTFSEVEFAVNFFREYMGAVAESTTKDIEAAAKG